MGGESKEVTKKDAPDWAEDIFRRAIKEAINLYDKEQGGHSYDGQTMPDLTDKTKRSINELDKNAKDYQDRMKELDYLNQPTQSQQNLQDMASGKYLKEGNPYFKDMLHQMVNESNDLIQSKFAGMGRYGSAADTNALAMNTQKILSKGLSEDYERALNNMQRANQQIDFANRGQADLIDAWSRGKNAIQKDALAGSTLVDQWNQKKTVKDQDEWHAKDNEAWDRLKMLLETAQKSVGPYSKTETVKNDGIRSQWDKLFKLFS